ncbi:MAG TPA: hypothetical protein VFL91_33800 [Thermomicrobiales bacterium]|nr:hypothetical protein [Thermomicrobiales bacterium]
MPMWLAGLIGGLIGGVAMAMVAMMLMPMLKQSPLYPVQLMAATVEGPSAVGGGMSADMLGAMIHMVMSAIFGVIYGVVLGALGWTALWVLIVAGIVWALFLYVVNEYGTLPLIDKVMAERMPPLAFMMSHVAYGAVLGVLVWVLR